MPILKNLQYFGMWANSIHKQSVRIKHSIFLKFTICFEGGWKWNIFLSLYSIFLLAIFNFPTSNIPIPIQSELESTEQTQKMLLFSFKLILILFSLFHSEIFIPAINIPILIVNIHIPTSFTLNIQLLYPQINVFKAVWKFIVLKMLVFGYFQS